MTEHIDSESQAAERAEVKAQLIDLLKQVDELEARMAELDAKAGKAQPEKSGPLKRH